MSRNSIKSFIRLQALRVLDSLLTLKSEPFPTLKEAETVLVFAPHPDDESFGCGGLIASLTARKVNVAVVFLTNGEASHQGHPQLGPEEIGSRRRQEAARACSILGVPGNLLYFLQAPDGQLDKLSPSVQSSLETEIETILQKLGPGLLLVPLQDDASSDHNAAHRLVRRSAFRLASPPLILEYAVWARWSLGAYVAAFWNTENIFRVDITSHRSAKRQAWQSHESQVRALPPWTQSVLPSDFIRQFESKREFYFQS